MSGFATRLHLSTLRNRAFWHLIGRCSLHRLFSAFPAGPPGVGLLLLRAVVGITVAAQGILCLYSRGHLTVTMVVSAMLLLVSGISIVIGFMTRILCPLAGFACMGIALSWFPLPGWNLFDSKLIVAQMIAISAAIALLGPGAFSIDARLFGWKEIVIPPAPHTPER